FLEHLPVVRVEARLLLRSLALLGPLRGLLEILAIHVAERNDLYRRDLHQAEDVRLSVPAAADQADSLRSLRGIQVMIAGRGCCQPGETRLQETAPIHTMPLSSNTIRIRLYFLGKSQTGGSRKPGPKEHSVCIDAIGCGSRYFAPR